MKNLYKFFCLALGVYLSAFAQITEITRLPVQDISQSIKESAPVWLSENEIIIFYVNQTLDTIFSTRSNDRGIKWGEPTIVQTVNLLYNQDALYLSTLLTSTGRLLLAWSVIDESMKLIYSDDYGGNWSQPIDILGTGVLFAKRSTLLNLTQWESGEICLSFYSLGISLSHYRLSYDNGVSWESDPIEFPRIAGENLRELSIISVGEDSLLAIFERGFSESRGIYSRVSNDNGINWSESSVISDDDYYEKRSKVVKLDNGNIVVVYLRNNVNVETSYDEDDIYYKVGDDKGSIWSLENRFTKYIGEDNFINLSSFQNKTLLTFATERFSSIHPNGDSFQIAYGILEETVEKFTPPKVYETYVPPELVNLGKKEFVYRAVVIDDESVQKVSISIEDSVHVLEMFDDGMHFDEKANDSIYANVIPIINGRYLEAYYFNINKIELPLDNRGVLADINIPQEENVDILSFDSEQNIGMYSELVRFGDGGSMGKYEEGSFLFSSGFFISGYVNGNLFANGVASSALLEDYLPGKVGSDPEDPLNVIYIVSKNDPPFGSSWQRWKDAVLIGADFYDGDKDGIYNPVDLNWNGTWDTNEDMPPLIGDEIVWCVYNDGVPADQRRIGFEIDPIGIEIQQTLFATSNLELENVIFIKYKVTNTGLVSDVLDSAFFSPWDDTDIGDATDDLSGSDTLLQSIFTYNYIDDAVYGNTPPAIFITVLQGPVKESTNISDTAYIRNGEIIGEEFFPGYENLGLYSFSGYAKSDPTQGDPRDIYQVWNYVHARDRQGNLLDPCDTLYGKVYGGVDCSQINPMFWFSGNPVIKLGWIDKQARDDRKFSSIGSLSLEKDKSLEIILALVVGRGTDDLNSITVARENVHRAIQEYQSNFASMTYSAPAATNPIASYVLYQNYPNPFNPTTTIRYELPQDGVVTIDIYDILGQKVRTILNEFQKADRYEVTFNSTGLASGVYIYQLRVNDFIQSKKMVLIR